MVQNWENFMDPAGGAYETSFATGGASIMAGLGIDLVARRAVDNFTKISAGDRIGLGRRFYGVGTFREGGLQPYSSYGRGGRLTGPRLFGEPSRVVGQTIPGVGKIGTDGNFKPRVYPAGKQGMLQRRQEINKYIKQTEGRLKKRYAGTSSLLKGLSWTLVATGVMMAVEGATTPGTVSRQAMLSDQRAMGVGQGPMDSQQAYTQRQRALMAIHDSQLGIRNVIGNEAGHLHR